MKGGWKMSVFVTMRVKVPDYKAFRDASNELNARGLFPGQHSAKVYRSEADPNDLLVVQEWDSHDDFHKASEEVGEEFQAKAKTEGLDWVTFVGKLADDIKHL
jgi:quinol monooxygenase YgiN